MDGTLVDSHAVTERVWTRWTEKHGVAAAPVLDAMIGVRPADTIRRFGPPGLDVAAEAADIFAAEMAELDGIVEIPGAARFLTTLPPDRWAVVTSASRELALRRLAAAGLPLPRVLVSADDITRGKPAPDGFIAAATKLGFRATACAVWEDSRAGIAAGEAAGATVIVVAAMAHAPRDTGHHVVADYANLYVTPTDDGLLYLHGLRR